MVKKYFIVILLMALFSCNEAFCKTAKSASKNPAIPYPVIFVHGIGDSSVAWKVTGPKVSAYYDRYYKTPDHPSFLSGSGIVKDRDDRDFTHSIRNSCVYFTAKDYYADPSSIEKELEVVIEATRNETFKYFPNYFKSKNQVKVNLVAHSMGGLVCRKYIVEHPANHYVSRFIIVDTPNIGTSAFDLRWVPQMIEGGGILGAIAISNPIGLCVSGVGIAADIILHKNGVSLLSPAAESMCTNSEFLKYLNHLPLPENIIYSAIISDSSEQPYKFFNFILGFRNGGDGAVPVESQSLKYAGIPNFNRIQNYLKFSYYEEYALDSPHFQAPTRAGQLVIDTLKLKSK